ncbi:MAG: dihydrolipoamide acetyltransferase family protein [Mariprofundales bacterium]
MITSRENQEHKKTQRIKASPLARRLALKAGVDLKSISGSGPSGRIVRADIERAQLETPIKSQHAVVDNKIFANGDYQENYEEVENSMMRRAIARRLVESKQQAPHFYLTLDINMQRLVDFRQQINAAAAGEFKLSINDLIIKATAKALHDVPAANASWTEKAILRHKHAHISVAVSVAEGLITPVVRYAAQKSLPQIATEVRALAKKARAGELKPEEYSGGTFTISNLGMFGIREFAAVINPPEGAILAVGATEERAVVEVGKIVARQMMTVTLSCDHRVVDGVAGAKLLSALKKHLEQPAGLLL